MNEGGEETAVPGENPWWHASESLCQYLNLSVPSEHPVAESTQPRDSLSFASLFNVYMHKVRT